MTTDEIRADLLECASKRWMPLALESQFAVHSYVGSGELVQELTRDGLVFLLLLVAEAM